MFEFTDEKTLGEELRDELHPYKHGEIVWVKMGHCFWPGEVRDYNTLPDDIQNSKQKVPLVTVKFFGEETYEFVKTLDKIYTYNCTKKDDFIMKGLNLYRGNNKYMEKFPSDVKIAERMIGGDENIIDDPKFALPEKEKPTRQSSTKKKGRGRPSLNTTPGARKVMPMTNRNITHRRFTGDCSDFSIRVRVQKNQDPPRPIKIYTCHVCGYETTSVEVISMHHKHQLHKHKSSGSKSKRKVPSTVTSKSKGKSRKLTYEEDVSSDLSDQGIGVVASDDEENEADDHEQSTSRPSSSSTSLTMEDNSITSINPSQIFSSSTRLEILNDWDDDCLDGSELNEEQTSYDNSSKINSSAEIDEKTSKINIIAEIDESSESNDTNNSVELLKESVDKLDVNDVDKNETTAKAEELMNKIEGTKSKTDSPPNIESSNKDVILSSVDKTLDDLREKNETVTPDESEDLINDIVEMDSNPEDILNNIDNDINKSIESTTKLEQGIAKIHAENDVPKPKVLDYFDFTEEDDSNDEKLEDINPHQSEKTNSGIEDFNKLLESAKLPETTDNLKCEQNFHQTKTIKFPDKNSDEKTECPAKDMEKPEVATKLTNPKKRFVKSFEDFEQSLKIERERSEMNKKTDSEEIDSNNRSSELSITSEEISIKEVFEKTKHKIIKSFEDFEQSLIRNKQQAEDSESADIEMESNIQSEAIVVLDTNNELINAGTKTKDDKEKTQYCAKEILLCDIREPTATKAVTELNKVDDNQAKLNEKSSKIDTSEADTKNKVTDNSEDIDKKLKATSKMNVAETTPTNKSTESSEDTNKKPKTEKKNENMAQKSEPVKKLVEINLFDKEDKSKLKTKMDDTRKDTRTTIRRVIKAQIQTDSSGKHIIKLKKSPIKPEPNKKTEASLLKIDDKLKGAKDGNIRRVVEDDRVKMKSKAEDKLNKEKFSGNPEEVAVKINSKNSKEQNTSKEEIKSNSSEEVEIDKSEDKNKIRSKDTQKTDCKLLSKGGKEIVLKLADDLKRLSKDEPETKLKSEKAANAIEEKNLGERKVRREQDVMKLEKILTYHKTLEKSNDNVEAVRISKLKRKSTDAPDRITPTNKELPTKKVVNPNIIANIDLTSPKKPKLDEKSESLQQCASKLIQVSKLKYQLMNKLNDADRKSLQPSASTFKTIETRKELHKIKSPRRFSLTTQELTKKDDKVEVSISRDDPLKNKKEEASKKSENLIPSSSCVVEDMEIETDLKETVAQDTPQVVKIITPEFSDNSALNTLATVSEMSSLDLIQVDQEVNIDKNIRVVTESDLTDKEVEIAKVPILEEGTIKGKTIASFSVDFTSDLYVPDVKLDLKNIDKPIKSKVKAIDNLKISEINKGNKGSNINSVEMEMAKLTHTSIEQEATTQPQEATTSKKLLEILSENKSHSEITNVKSPQVLDEVKQKGNNLTSQKNLLTGEPSEKKVKTCIIKGPIKTSESSIALKGLKLKTYESPKPKIQGIQNVKSPVTHSTPVMKISESTERSQKPMKKFIPAVTKTSPPNTNQLLNTKVGIINDDSEVSVKKISLDKLSADYEDMDTFIIQKHQKRPMTEKLLETPPTKILKKALNKPLQMSQSVIKTTNKGEDNIFDIDAMPIVLDDRILTSENVKTIPLMMNESKTPQIQHKKNPPSPMKLLNKAGSSIILKDTPLKTGPSQKTYVKTVKRVINTTASTFVRDTSSTASTNKFVASAGSSKTIKQDSPKKPITLQSSASKVQNIVQEPTGNKIMIVTNNQGQQSRVLLTPAQQKLMGYQTVKKTIVKTPSIQNSPKNVQSKTSMMKPKTSPPSPSNLVPVKKTNRFESKNKLIGQKVILNTQGQVKGQQRTILIKNAQGQTVKKIQGTDDALLEQQVAEQIEAINRATNAKTQIQYKPSPKREVIKKTEPTKLQNKTHLIYNPASTSKNAVPPLAPISPSKKPEVKQTVHKSTKVVNTPIIHGGDLGQGNSTAIAEGQILALPCETLDGQPQSYMLVKLDETGNFTPLNNEALLSLDPNLNLGGDLSNMVLQIDQNESIKVATAPKEDIIPIVSQKLEETSVVIDNSTQLIEEAAPAPVVEDPGAIQTIACTINSGESAKQLIITGDPVSTQKFIESLNEANSDLTNILTSAEGNILIHIDGQQILINTDTDNQTLMDLNPQFVTDLRNENAGNPIFGSNNQSQDILAAALADTDVFQQEQTVIPSNNLVASQLSPGSSLYPLSVNNVLETSTMNSPIMTPLEVPSTNTKKINDEVDILSQVPKNVDLPITITDPNITQTVAQQQAAILASELHSNLELPITIQDVSVTSSDITNPFGYTLPLDVSVDIQKPFRSSISMPLLTEDSEDTHVSIVNDHVSEVIEHPSVDNESVSEITKHVSEITEVSDHISEITEHISEVSKHVHEVTEHISDVPDDISEITEQVSEVPEHISEVTEHVSVVTERVSEVEYASVGNETDCVKESIEKPMEEISIESGIIETTVELEEVNIENTPEKENMVEVEKMDGSSDDVIINNVEMESHYPNKLKEEYLLTTTSISTISNQMSSSLSEPPPDMFDFSLDSSFELKNNSKNSEEDAEDFSVHDVNNGDKFLETESEKSGSRLETPDTHSPSTNSTDDSCEIPVQPEIVTEISNKPSESKLDGSSMVLEEGKEC